MVPVFVMVMRPLLLTTRTGLATTALVGVLDVVVAVRMVVVVPSAVREELTVASDGDPEMLAGGLTTAAAVGERVRTLANPLGEETALLVGVTTVPDGAITGPAAFVTFVLVVVLVLPVAVTPLLSRKFGAALVLATASPAPLVIASVGPE